MTRAGFAPFAVDKNIPPGSNDPRIAPRVAILHVDAGDASSLYDYFKDRSGGVESHFFVKKNGVIEQYRSIWYQADANYRANDFAISIETQGKGSGEWNAAQLASIFRLLNWIHDETNGAVPLRKVTEWDGRGVGYHVQFGAPGPWTPVAKSCPGPDRIKQYHNTIIPGLASGEGADMSWSETAAKWAPESTPNAGKQISMAMQLNQARGYAEDAYDHARTANARTARIEKAITALAKGLGKDVEEAVEAALKDAVIDVNVNVSRGE